MSKEVRLVALSFFSLFFGAGNLILPPFLGYKAFDQWLVVAVGFCATAVLIPYLGILAHSKIQGGLYELAQPILKKFSLLYTSIIFIICLLIVVPRTAAVTYELGVAPFTSLSPLLSALIFFGGIPFFALYRGRVLSIIGNYITPLLVTLMVLLIIQSSGRSVAPSPSPIPFGELISSGVIEGYQTFDAIAAVVVGAVLVLSVKNQFSYLNVKQQSNVLKQGGLWAAFALMSIYFGLIYSGASLASASANDYNRSELLIFLSSFLFEGAGTQILGVTVALACFTTAVGIVTGAADFVNEQIAPSRKAYVITIAIACIAGVLLATLGVEEIIRVAYPMLLLIYPLTIVLILLHLLPKHLTGGNVLQIVATTTFLFSIPDAVLGYFESVYLRNFLNIIPLGVFQLGWLFPSLLSALISISVHSLGSRYDQPQ
jgi:LIVCS family branched-chain amino acid:cation transporter